MFVCLLVKNFEDTAARMSNVERKPHSETNARNTGSGKQYIFHGNGDQNAVYENGTLVKYYSQHINSKHSRPHAANPCRGHY